jgi:uridylate kinase
MSALSMTAVCDDYSAREAIRQLEQGRVTIFAAGTGNPFFTTDTTAALRASELGCDVMLKATRVDGVYDSDPEKNPGARRFTQLTYRDVIERDLKVMDLTAITMCLDNSLPIVVFDVLTAGNLRRVVAGEGIGTVVSAGA